MSALTSQEIHRLVYDYIGVEAGYLVGFSYSSHQEFYPYYCGLDIDPLKLTMTTRERFIHILQNASPIDQAKILRGTLVKLPPQSDEAHRKSELATEIESWARRCEGMVVPASITLSITSELIDRAISDAEVLIRENGATSGLDRIHTMIHGYLLAMCDSAGVTCSKEANITALFGLLRHQHPRLHPTGPRSEDVTRLLRALAQILDVLNPLRNHASIAHPNLQLLGEDEARLVINAARSFMQYVTRKLS